MNVTVSQPTAAATAVMRSQPAPARPASNALSQPGKQLSAGDMILVQICHSSAVSMTSPSTSLAGSAVLIECVLSASMH